MTHIFDFKESERHVPPQPARVDDNQPPRAQSTKEGLLGAILDNTDIINCVRNMVELADFCAEEKVAIADREGRIECGTPYGIHSERPSPKRNRTLPASPALRGRE